MQVLGHSPGEDFLVGGAQHTLQSGERAVRTGRNHLLTPGHEQFPQRRLSPQRGAELALVAFSHSGEEVQPLGGPRTDPADDRDGDAPVAGQSSTRQRMGATPEPPTTAKHCTPSASTTASTSGTTSATVRPGKRVETA